MPSVSNIDEVNFAIKRGQSQAIRTMSDEQGNPLFCEKDVAEALGYTNPEKALRNYLELEDKGVNESFTPGERSKPSSSTSPASTPSSSLPSY